MKAGPRSWSSEGCELWAGRRVTLAPPCLQVGTHEELLKKGGLYSELIRRQALDTPPPEPPRIRAHRHSKS